MGSIRNRALPPQLSDRDLLKSKELACDSFDIAKLYDEIAECWSRDKPQVRDDHITWPLIIALASECGRGGVVLDCGCGTGNICRLVSPIAKSVVGIDVSKKMISEAEKHTPSPSNIIYIRRDMRQLTP